MGAKYMGDVGNFTGLLDKNGRRIYIGDKMRFLEREWGSADNEFTVSFAHGELQILGTIENLSEFCEVIEEVDLPDGEYEEWTGRCGNRDCPICV